LFASEEYDRGDIITIEAIQINYPIKIAYAIDEISNAYKKCIDKIFLAIRSGEQLIGISQNEVEATYSLWLDDEDYQIDWSLDSFHISRFVDAVGSPYSGAYSLVNGEKLRILDVEPLPDVVIENRTPGKVISVVDGQPTIVCGHGLLKITNMQREDGSSALPLKKFRTRFT